MISVFRATCCIKKLSRTARAHPSYKMQKGSMHEVLKPLSWLIGRWKSIRAEGSYPTIKPFTYCEELCFESIGQPILNYTSQTWHPEKGNPMHLESGFLRIKPGTNQIAFMVSHNFGLTTLEEGNVEGNALKCKTMNVSRMSFAQDPAVLSIERSYQLCEDGNLQVVVLMKTATTPLVQHLKATYKKM